MSTPPQKHFIVCGLSRLSSRVVRALEDDGQRVTVIMYDVDKPSLRMILPHPADVLTATAENATAILAEAGLAQADCVLALSEDDAANLRTTVSARSIVSDIPVVMRAFDPLLAEQFEKKFGVRRAYSVSALAAPAFIAAAAGAEMLGSLRLGTEVIPFCRLTVNAQSPLVGKSLDSIETDHEVTLIAVSRQGGEWTPYVSKNTDTAVKKGEHNTFSTRYSLLSNSAPATSTEGNLKAGDSILFGSTPRQALTLCIYAAGWYKRNTASSDIRGRGSSGVSIKKRPVSGARKSQTYLPLMIVCLLLFATLAMIIFKYELNISFLDAIYFTMTTMVTIGDGDIDMAHYPPWLKLFQCLVMVNGGALLGVSFSYLTTLATAERLEVTMARQAERMKGHIIIVGLGNVGYRVAQALTDLGLDKVVVDLAPPPRFYDSVSRHAPVLTGDARVSDFLDRIAVTEAEAIIACTSNDVANVETCLHARRMNPKIRTVARVFDSQIIGTVASAFAIDKVLSATSIAQSAFVIAANDVNSVLRINVGSLDLSAVRYRARTRIVKADVKVWHGMGIHLLAFMSESGHSSCALSDELTHETIALGSETAIRWLLERDALLSTH